MQFNRLRPSGFKSFVDQTETAIREGLTGVMGPNGCGKSNLLEALRWVMGESRATAMRGKKVPAAQAAMLTPQKPVANRARGG